MQKGMAELNDVTAERGDVLIEQRLPASTRTVDGNLAVASSI